MKFKEYFDRIRIISLPYRLDRRSEVRRELDRHGLSLEPGKVEFFDGIRKETADGFPTVGQHGCYLSHLELLKESRASGLSNVMIFEDDFQLSTKFASVEESIVKQLQDQPWDIAYIGHLIPTPPTSAPTLITADPKKHILMLHAYAINGKVLDRLIEFMELILSRPKDHPDGGRMGADGVMSWFRERNPDVVTLMLAPSVCWQRSSRTDNHDLMWKDRLPVVRDMFGALRKVKVMMDSFR